MLGPVSSAEHGLSGPCEILDAEEGWPLACDLPAHAARSWAHYLARAEGRSVVVENPDTREVYRVTTTNHVLPPPRDWFAFPVQKLDPDWN